jgi:SAM-dependent methyltransferase
METVVDERIQRERDHHNDRFGRVEDPRRYLDKWYATIRHSSFKLDDLVRAASVNKVALEYGCADGSVSLDEMKLPQIAAEVIGIDISEKAIEKANADAQRRGYANARYLAMNAEEMEFADKSFDVVFGRGILHHLDLDKSLSDIARVLRPGGKAMFIEPMAYNPILNHYRNKTPDIRTVDEHPLVVSDFKLARRYFSKVDVTFYGLFSVASGFVNGTWGWPYRVGKAIDNIVLRVPFIGKYAWYTLLVMHKGDG